MTDLGFCSTYIDGNEYFSIWLCIFPDILYEISNVCESNVVISISGNFFPEESNLNLGGSNKWSVKLISVPLQIKNVLLNRNGIIRTRIFPESENNETSQWRIFDIPLLKI